MADLFGVARASNRSVWAVGGTRVFTKHARLTILHWNGAAWTRAATPSLSGASVLNGVAAVSARSVWAVGGTLEVGTDRTLILHWNGTTWKRVTS